MIGKSYYKYKAFDLNPPLVYFSFHGRIQYKTMIKKITHFALKKCDRIYFENKTSWLLVFNTQSTTWLYQDESKITRRIKFEYNSDSQH